LNSALQGLLEVLPSMKSKSRYRLVEQTHFLAFFRSSSLSLALLRLVVGVKRIFFRSFFCGTR